MTIASSSAHSVLSRRLISSPVVCVAFLFSKFLFYRSHFNMGNKASSIISKAPAVRPTPATPKDAHVVAANVSSSPSTLSTPSPAANLGWKS